MTINSLKDLDKLLKLLRSQGVKSIDMGGIKLELNDSVPMKEKPSKIDAKYYNGLEDSLTNINASISVPQPEIPTDAPTEEELLFWSASGSNQPIGEQQ